MAGRPSAAGRPGTAVVHPDMLDAVQAVATGAMRDTCRISPAATSPGVLNRTTGLYAPGVDSVLYEGACRLQPATKFDRLAEVGEDMVTFGRYLLHLPMTAALPTVDSIVVILTSTDPHAAGLRLRIVDVRVGDLQAWRQIVCELDEG